MTPRHAQLLAGDLDTETLIRYIDPYLMYYIRTAERLERTAPWMERIEVGSTTSARSSSTTASAWPTISRRRWPATSGLLVRVEGRPGRPGQAVALRVLRQRPGTPDPTVSFGENNGRKVPVLLGTPAMPVSQK